MATEKVKVYEEQPKKGLPAWAWILPLLLLLALGIWYFTGSHSYQTQTAAAPVTDQTKPDNGAGTAAATTATAATAGTTWTAATIADSIRKNGRVGFDSNDVHFTTGSAALAGDSQAVLDQTAQALKDNSDWKMRIVGHTDAVGSDTSNEQLAQTRANSVKKYLVLHGVDQSRLDTDAKGASNPVATNQTDAGRAENRRVDLIKE